MKKTVKGIIAGVGGTIALQKYGKKKASGEADEALPEDK